MDFDYGISPAKIIDGRVEMFIYLEIEPSRQAL